MNVWNWLKQTPLWLVVPSVFLAAGVATAVTHYEPLVFDPSLYEVPTASAAENSVYLNRALNYNGLRLKGVKTQVQSRLEAGAEVTGVDVVSNATYSCNAFLDAFYEAVKSAHDEALSLQG